MTDQTTTMVMASFAADTLALGVHWIYDTSVIDEKHGRVQEYVKPSPPTFHTTKEKGEFTHYGDQMLVLLEYVAQNTVFDLDSFAQKWRTYFADYTGYFDGATKQTLQNFTEGNAPAKAGSSSADLGGAARIAPLVCRYSQDLEQMIESCRLQTTLTHSNPLVVDSAEFFGRVAHSVLNGQSPLDAIQQVKTDVFNREPFSGWVEDGLASTDLDTRQTISDFGQMCESAAAFPGVIHLISKYETDLENALIENVMAGGDSAARGMLVGMVLGAGADREAIPQAWIKEMASGDRIIEMLDRI